MSAAAAAADTAGERLPATPPSGRRVEGHDERPSHAAANATGPPLPVQERSWYGLSSDTLFRLIEPGRTAGLRWVPGLTASGGGELEHEGGALALLRVDPDPAVHLPDELLADVEAQAGAAHAPGQVSIEPVELLEDPHLLVNGYAETLVGDGEPDVAVRPLERHADTT